MPFAEVRGARLFFTDEGSEAPPMLFVHGFSCDSHDWSWQLPFFKSWHRIIAVDLRGHGRSSAPEEGYEFRSLVADMAAFLDHLRCGPVVAIGHSHGGAIVAAMAVERPDLVRAVVAIDPGHLLPDEAGRAYADTLAEFERGDPVTLARQAFAARQFHTASTPPALAVWHSRRVASTPAHVIRKMVMGTIGGSEPYTLRSNSEPYLAQLRRPLLSLHAQPAPAAVSLGLFPPPSKTVCFEGSGHWLHQERPIEVNTVIADWLVGLPENGRPEPPLGHHLGG
jgi:pimeloyl-ACP methyl ester carboxylesterase